MCDRRVSAAPGSLVYELSAIFRPARAYLTYSCTLVYTDTSPR